MRIPVVVGQSVSNPDDIGLMSVSGYLPDFLATAIDESPAG